WQGLRHQNAGFLLAFASQSLAAAPPAPVRAPSTRRAPRHIVIVSTPAGARVAIDGQRRCTTPCGLTLLPAEQVLVEVASEGYIPWRQELRPESLGAS